MPYTTDTLVKGVLTRDYDDVNNPSLAPFITAGGIILNQMIACLARKGIVYDTDTLQTIETWLAAHCYANSDKPYASKSTEGASASFHGRTDMYLESTLYGQMAVQLDGSGCLRTIATQTMKKAGGVWLGKTKTQQIDYDQRN